MQLNIGGLWASGLSSGLWSVPPKNTIKHYQAVVRLLRYVAGTLDYGLRYERRHRSAGVIGYSDADHGDDIDDRKSTRPNANPCGVPSAALSCLVANSCLEYGSLFSSLTTGLYLTFKLTSVVEKVQSFLAAAKALSRKDVHYGSYATAEQ
ncbi:hypothetical protein U9M48_043128, partial [Paspalum notatum var. saurae]